MINRWKLSCRAATELMERQLREELNRSEKIKLGLHTLICSACRRYEKQTQLIEQLFRAKEKAAMEAKTEAQIEILEEKILEELKRKDLD
ncbi:MAG: hypothetical protein R2824_31750 [Saprospiraceae bacterium]|nr:hypothetical protein [Lewinella sp.]